MDSAHSTIGKTVVEYSENGRHADTTCANCGAPMDMDKDYA